jgi:amino acid transporter
LVDDRSGHQLQYRSSIFGLPSKLARLLGRASPLAMVVAAVIVSIMVACMTEVAWTTVIG